MLTTFKILENRMRLEYRESKVKKRNIVLRMETYERLQQYLLELIQKRGNPKITFDEAINALLDEHEERVER
jgi:hypothetical protein